MVSQPGPSREFLELWRQLQQHGMDQEKLAAELYVSRPTVSRWITGQIHPHPSRLEAMRQLLFGLKKYPEPKAEAPMALREDEREHLRTVRELPPVQRRALYELTKTLKPQKIKPAAGKASSALAPGGKAAGPESGKPADPAAQKN